MAESGLEAVVELEAIETVNPVPRQSPYIEQSGPLDAIGDSARFTFDEFLHVAVEPTQRNSVERIQVSASAHDETVGGLQASEGTDERLIDEEQAAQLREMVVDGTLAATYSAMTISIAWGIASRMSKDINAILKSH